jgi:hypothetical protein
MNDEFENSIRKKLNEADIPFDQDAWSKMESLLDAGDKNKRPIPWWWWLFQLLLLGGMGWWIIQSTPAKEKAGDAAISINKANDQSIETVESSNGIKQENNSINKADHPQAGPPAYSEHTSGNGIVAPTNETAASANPNNTTVNQADQHFPPTAISSENQTNNKTISKPGNHLPEKNNTTSGDHGTIPGAQSAIAINDITSTAPPYDIQFLKIKNVNNVNVYTKIYHPPEIPINKDTQTVQQQKIPRRKVNSKGLYIGVTLGPDLNVAPSFNYGRVGFNAGVLAHYYFNRRWFITTGAVYSKKLYGATKTDYQVPGNGSVPYDLVKVNANCDVLDIPVNMNYTFLQVNNNTFSATLGLSNYFMLKEKYEYVYKYSPKWEKTVQNENQHYLAILNVGALYQHPAGRRLIVGVQPYAKIPLHGVGLGQVKLYSAGVSFQLNLVGKKR